MKVHAPLGALFERRTLQLYDPGTVERRVLRINGIRAAGVRGTAPDRDRTGGDYAQSEETSEGSRHGAAQTGEDEEMSHT